MPFSLRVRLDPVVAPDAPSDERSQIIGMSVGFTTRGAGGTNAVRGSKVPATVEFLGRFTKSIRDKPTPDEKPLGQLAGQLVLSGHPLDVHFACDPTSLDKLTEEPPETTSDEDDEDDEDDTKRFVPRALDLEFGPSFTGLEALGDKVPRLLVPDDVGNYRYLEVCAKLTVQGSLEADFDVTDPLEVLIGRAPPPRLESRLPLDLLEEAAQKIEENEFLAWASSVFGSDIPLGAYRAWRKDLVGQKLEPPDIVLVPSGQMSGELGSYDNDRRQIRVTKGLPRKAETSPSDAASLFLVLLHEFGHHTDNLLRRSYSSVEGDAPGEEGASFAFGISGLTQDESEQLSFAAYTRDGESRDLALSFPEFHSAVQDYIADPQAQADAKRNNVEGFSAGRGRPDSNFFAHRSIEDGLGAADSTFFTQRVRDLIYFGNWERDYSQLCGSAMIRALQIAEGPFPTPAMLALPRKAITDFLDRKAQEEFPNIQPTRVTTTNLGVYRPEEHVDNPQGLTDDRSVDHDFRGPIDPRELEVDPNTGIKNYIAHDGQGYATSTAYVSSSLTRALAAGLTPEGLRLLGQSLHTIEDLYAHSNFVELTLIRLGHRLVFPWVGLKSELVVHGDTRYPMVTGVFGFVDSLVSGLSSIGENLGPRLSCQGKVFSKQSVEALSLVLNALADAHSDDEMIPMGEPIQVNQDILGAQLTDFSKWLCEASEGAKTWLKRKLGAVLKATLGELAIFESGFIQDIPNTGRTDPTHSMLSKDHPDHPLHPIAAACAKSAVAAVGLAMRDAWMGLRTPADAIAVATRFFIHPNDIPLVPGDPRADLVNQIDAFAKANPGVVAKLDAVGAYDTFRKHSDEERKELSMRADEMIDHDDESARRALALLPGLDPHIAELA